MESRKTGGNRKGFPYRDVLRAIELYQKSVKIILESIGKAGAFHDICLDLAADSLCMHFNIEQVVGWLGQRHFLSENNLCHLRLLLTVYR